MLKSLLRPFLYILILFCILSCGRRSPSKTAESTNDALLDMPDTEIFNFTYKYTKNERTVWELFSDKASVFKEKNLTRIEGVHLVFYRTNRIDTTVDSKFGEIRDETRLLSSISNVVLRTSDGTVLYTDLLHWDNSKNLLFTDQYVKIIRKNNDIIQGIGMEADHQLQKLIILKQVSGRIHEKKK